MGKLIYAGIASLDGYVADDAGNFDWAMPDDEVHSFINELERTACIYLYGRRMYETMAGWETDPSLARQSPIMRDFAEIWQAAEKIVFSRTLNSVSTTRTRIESSFDPEAIRKMKADTSCDILVGGPELAAQAIKAGLVDEYHLFVTPVAVGSGKRFLPSHAVLKFELMDERRFSNGMVYLRYRTRG